MEKIIDKKSYKIKKVKEWTKEDVAEWLKDEEFDEAVINNFIENDIKGEHLENLNNEKLRDDLKISKLGTREDLLKKIENLKGKKIFY